MALVVEAGDMAAVDRELKALGRVRYCRGVGRGGCAARGECECKAKAANGYYHTFVLLSCFFSFFFPLSLWPGTVRPYSSSTVVWWPGHLVTTGVPPIQYDMVADDLIYYRRAKFSLLPLLFL